MERVCTKISNGSLALLKLRNYVDLNSLKMCITFLYNLIYSIVYQQGE